MHVGTKETVLVPGEVLCYYTTQHLHSSDGAKQLAEICPEEWGGIARDSSRFDLATELPFT